MKIQKSLLALILLFFQSLAFAHCPTSFKEEGACLMLDNNMIFIYDSKIEHNGPYKDFKKASLVTLKNSKGADLAFKKVARGIYKLLALEAQAQVVANVELDKKIKELKLNQN